ncbi:hypothetical protein [uncultured Ruminococcus sp.]|uniref:hypothetical protein n=1 Tax=uncultured Ruminococcus sp. TaxID=165186 RepID=UPI0025FBD419|nr:hypothetical protein [uncultured Ruminococcus sp.]
MTSISDVLKASKGVPVDDIFAELWGRKLSGDYTIVTYTGTLPAVLTNTKAGYLHHYKIYGNTVQDGTPTPENPIEPSECGELETTGAHAGQYKLPLTSAGQDVDIYLGESQTTRQIKKLVFDGTEDWRIDSGRFTIILNDIKSQGLRLTEFYCSSYQVISDGRAYSDVPNNAIYTGAGGPGGTYVYIFTDEYTTTTSFKTYLAQQYANGTPVTVWYVLATEKTGILNEPLRKIGDYADTIDSTQTSAQIPTAAGSTTISWAGSGLAPSEVELEYERRR